MQGLDLLRANITPVLEADPTDQLLDVAKTFQAVEKRKTADTVALKLDDLRVDPDYQRPPDREKIASMVKRMARGDQLDPIKVNCRQDGSMWITDGQHRAAAAAIRGEDEIDAEVTFKPQQDEPAETNIMAKVAAEDDLDAISLLLGAGARRHGKRLVLDLGRAGTVAYVPHEEEWVGKTERGQLRVEGEKAREVVDRLGLDGLSLETAGFSPRESAPAA